MYAHSAGQRPTPGPGSQRSGAATRPGRPGLAVRSRDHGPATVLAMQGDLVADTVVTAEARILTTVVLSARPLRLVLDLSGVGAVDSQGAALLAKTRFAVRAARGTLHLVAPYGSPARRVLNRHLLKAAVQRIEDLDTEFGTAPAGS